MSEAGFAGWLGEHHTDESPAERSVRQARQAAERTDRQDERSEAERRAVLAERHDLLELAQLQAGIPARTTGDVFADATRAGDEDAAYEAARATMEKIDRRRAARQRGAVEQAERMAEVTGLASRSATITGGEDMLAPAKAALKEHREFAAITRAKLSAAVTGQPRQASSRRPFAAEVSRSELECWYCVSNNVSAEHSALLHHDPDFAVPVTTLDQALAAEQAEHAERRQHGRPVISR